MRTVVTMLLIVSSYFAFLTNAWAVSEKGDYVVLLHGVGQSRFAMLGVEKKLQEKGYRVFNLDYPSVKYPLSKLYNLVSQDIKTINKDNKQKIHFIGFSLGALLTRMFLEYERPENVGYAVQIAPPNQGSELVDYEYNIDRLRQAWGVAPFDAGSGKFDVPPNLGAVEGYRLGVIAGGLSETTFSDVLIDGPDDGVVSVDNTRVKGMREHIVIKEKHHKLLDSDQVMNKAVDFIRWGTFYSYY